MSNNAIETLLKQRDKLVLERDAAIARFDDDIRGLETAIERLSSKKVWEAVKDTVYDDEHPDYIKGSIED